ncbi:MAG: hypothetical protein PHS41_13310, partial [Victivallaceae bacterium]|nr:hypothetical protein [Victivallaceae bacterium]
WFLKVSESYFQSMNRTGTAAFLIYFDSFIIFPLCLIILPEFLGLNGVWAAMPISKLVIFILAVEIWRYNLQYKKVSEKKWKTSIHQQKLTQTIKTKESCHEQETRRKKSAGQIAEGKTLSETSRKIGPKQKKEEIKHAC